MFSDGGVVGVYERFIAERKKQIDRSRVLVKLLDTAFRGSTAGISGSPIQMSAVYGEYQIILIIADLIALH